MSVKHINIAVASEQQALDMDPITVATPSQPPPLDAIVAVRERGEKERVCTLRLDLSHLLSRALCHEGEGVPLVTLH